MTKKEFCKTIVETVDNMNFIGKDKEEQAEAVMDLISALAPKDIKRFAKWGQQNQQSTVEECW